MTLLRTKIVPALLASLLAASFSVAEDSVSSKSTHAKPAHKAVTHKAGKKGKRSRKARGQAAIDGQRVREIQEALVREHYITAQPTGNWDAATDSAMRRYQADQGWQSKTVPDSRALIRLGLGPDHEHLLNPESAMTTEPRLRGDPQNSRGRTVSAAPTIPAASAIASPVSTGAVTPSR
jgi:peptidoglycan hydrolase-like protein with peptidoglycan-binding domain